MLRTAGTALAAEAAIGCQAETRRGTSRFHDALHSKTPPRDGSTPPSGGDRIDHRPNDGSGVWADFSNTGYLHDPGYTGSGGNCTHGYAGLNDYASGMTANTVLYVDQPVGHVFNQVHFRGTTLLGHTTGDNWTFNGCVFDNAGEGTGSSSFITQMYLPTAVTYNYCTFKPCDYTTPPGNNGTVATSPASPGTPCSSSWQSFNQNSNGSQTGNAVVHRYHCDVWGNVGMQDVFNGTASSRVILDWCYIHDQADTNSSGGCGYHHDGIGPCALNNVGYIDITNCTLASLGNTNGIAFQQCTCHDMTITGNYMSGWGYTVNLGGTLGTTDYNITFTDNVYSGEVAALYGGMYSGWAWNSAGAGMVWRRNQFQFFTGDPSLNSTWNGQYWWPSDAGGSPHASDYTG